MSVLFNMPWQQAFDSSGNTLAGAKLYFYEAGTTTPATVYADVGLGVPLSNPVIANGGGRFEPIYLDNGLYKAVLKTNEDVLIWSADNILTTSEETSTTVANEAIRQTSISAGYTSEEAQNPTNFVKSIYKYANSGNWFRESEYFATENQYLLTGLDDYIRLSDYFEGQNVWFIASTPNTGASTVNVDNLGAKNIIHADGTAVQAGDISGLVHLVYNGSSFVIQDVAHVNIYGDQTVYDTKTFDKSPLVPTPALSDSSLQSANTQFIKNYIKQALKPNYSGITSISSGYTAPKNGTVYLTQSLGNVTTNVAVDEHIILRMKGHSGSSHGQPRPCATVILGEGQKITFANIEYAYFVPFSY